MNIEFFYSTLAYAFVALAGLMALKYSLNFKADGHYSADEELEKGNLAVGIRRAGAYIGAGIALTGAFSGTSNESLTTDLLATFGYSMLGVVFMLSSLVLSDKAVLPGINNLKAIKAGNIAVALIECAMLIGTGIVANASLYGDGGSALSSLGFFVMGQVALIAVVLFAEKVITRDNDILANIKSGQVTSAVYLVGKILAFALIMKSAIIGQSVGTDVVTMVKEFLTLAAFGLAVLYLFEVIVDKVILTSTTVSDMIAEDKLAPALIFSAVKISLAFVLSNGVL